MKDAFKWTVEFEVSSDWVADGFGTGTQEDMEDAFRDMLCSWHGMMTESDVRCRLVSAPDSQQLKKAWGGR